MPTYGFPVLRWKDYDGHFTASLVEYNQTGIGSTLNAALLHLKEYLAWLYQEYPWQPAPDFLDPKLITYRVMVRPEYRIDDRSYPCDETMALRIACVHGRQEGGLLVCALPLLGVRFYYYDSQNLKDLVVAYVQEGLKGMAPRELTRFLPPAETVLDEIVVNISRKEKKRLYTPSITNLAGVADALGEPGLRKQFSRAWEREAEVADLVERLTREKANVILVGESGSGKSAVIVDAVRQIERKIKSAAPDDDDDEDAAYLRKHWLTNAARLIAGMQYLGQWQERCERLISELSNINGVLCIEGMLELVRNGGLGPSDSVAAFLIPYLQRGELRVVTEATPAELDACHRLLPAFADLFQIMKIEPLGHSQALAVLDRVATLARQNLHVDASPAVIELVHRLFHRFFPYSAFPGKTVAFLKELIEGAAVARMNEITTEQVLGQFIRRTGLPELFLKDDILLDKVEVVEKFASQVIGQRAACEAAAGVVLAFKAGLNDPSRPIGVLMFCGPTGVGKTELAKAVSRFFFGHGEQGERMIRLDMSEYSGPAAAERLIGNPEGEPSDLIKKIRQQPFVVLLFDEIEKAAPEVFDVLLGVFDEGRLTDRFGRTTTFRSAVIIMTSNLGADKFMSMGFDKKGAPSYAKEAMSFFRPEFFNRIDGIVRFDPLNADQIVQITRKELSEIASREGLKRKGIRLSWSDKLVSHLAKAGFDLRYGARPLQRTIEALVVAPLARRMVEGPETGVREIHLDVDEAGRVVFEMNGRAPN